MKKITSNVYLALAIISAFALMSNMGIKKSCYVPVTSEKGTSVLRPTGSPGDRTGSPGDGYHDCTDCHDNNVDYNLIPTINTSIPVTGYVLGQTYTIEVLTSSSGANGWGFELTAEKAGGTTVGVYDMTGATGSPKIITSGGSVTHSNDTSSSWSFNWTAPGVDQGDITFYAAVLAANGAAGNNGDQVVLTSEVVAPSTLSVDDINSLTFDVFPNPSRDYLTIKLPNEISEGSVEIFDFSGRTVMTAKINSIDNKLNLNNLSTGMYILRLNSEEKSGIKKVIKE